MLFKDLFSSLTKEPNSSALVEKSGSDVPRIIEAPQSGGIVEAPSRSGSIVEAPSKSGGIVEAPSRSGGIVEAPSKSGGIVESQSRSGGIFEAPSRSGGIVESSARSGGIVEAPSRSGGIVEAPSKSGGIVEAPSKSGGIVEAPSRTGGIVEAPSKAKADPSQYEFVNQTGKRLVKPPGSLNGGPFNLDGLVDCDVYLLDYTCQVQIDECVNCRIFIGPVDGSFFIRDCRDCVVTVACRQFRTRSCVDCDFRLFCFTQCPIIESSSRMRFTWWNGAYPQLGAHMKAANMDPSKTNYWNEIYDFNEGDSQYPFPHYVIETDGPTELQEVASKDVDGFDCGLPENPILLPHLPKSTSSKPGVQKDLNKYVETFSEKKRELDVEPSLGLPKTPILTDSSEVHLPAIVNPLSPPTSSLSGADKLLSSLKLTAPLSPELTGDKAASRKDLDDFAFAAVRSPPHSPGSSSPRLTSGSKFGRSLFNESATDIDYVRRFATRLLDSMEDSAVQSFLQNEENEEIQRPVSMQAFWSESFGNGEKSSQQQAFNKLIYRTVNSCLRRKTAASDRPWRDRSLFSSGFTPVTDRTFPGLSANAIRAQVVADVVTLFRKAQPEDSSTAEVQTSGPLSVSRDLWSQRIVPPQPSDLKIVQQILQLDEEEESQQWRDGAEAQEQLLFGIADNILDKMVVELSADIDTSWARKHRVPNNKSGSSGRRFLYRAS